MDSRPLSVSVLIPAYNEEGSIAATVAAVEARREHRHLGAGAVVAPPGEVDPDPARRVPQQPEDPRLEFGIPPVPQGRGAALPAPLPGRLLLHHDADAGDAHEPLPGAFRADRL